MIEWISVKEFVPDSDEIVITWGSKNNSECFYWLYKSHLDCKQFKWYCEDDNGHNWEVFGITHWSKINAPEDV